MTPDAVGVRVRWLNGRTETLNSMQPRIEAQDIQGLGPDMQWYSFRCSGEVDSEGYLIFLQAPEPIIMPPPSSEIVALSAPCSRCGKEMEIHCKANLGFGDMQYCAVGCPYGSVGTELPLPGDIVEVLRIDE
jgi:hypothetical protein